MDIKNEKQIQIMRQGGELLSRALKAVVDAVRPGVEMRELNAIAERVLKEGGGKPSFKGYKTKQAKTPFPSTVCVSRNNEIVHGFGTREDKLENGDIVSFDIGVKYKGLHTDMAVTVPVGDVSNEAKKLLEVTRRALLAGIGAVRDGAAISEIGKAIETYVKPHGYGIIRDLVGHGVGKQAHEDPHVPNFYDPRYDKIILKKGVTIAVEPMLTTGDWRIKTLEDGWTIVTADNSLAAHFEVTVAVTEKGHEILTPMVV